MSGPAPAAKSYDGTLILKDATQESYLQDAAGRTLLLMLDPTSSGNASRTSVVAAWNFYHTNSYSGAAISVRGFVTAPSNLHVVVP